MDGSRGESGRGRRCVFRHTILDPVFQHQLGALFGCFPPRRDGASRRSAAEVGDLLVRLVEDGMLLFQRHPRRILVRIAVQPSGFSSAMLVY